MIKIDSEWDLGYDDRVFQSEADARSTLKNDPNVIELSEQYGSVDDMIREGLISFKTLLLG